MKKKVLAFMLALLIGLSAAPPALAAGEPFSDIAGSWAYDDIVRAGRMGWVEGVGGGRYAPAQAFTCAQLTAMMTRAFYGQGLNQTPPAGEKWYAPYQKAAIDAGINENVFAAGDDLDAAVNRYRMAQMMYLIAKDLAPSAAVPAAAQNQIADQAKIPQKYNAAVQYCYAAGLLRGVDGSGTFDGESSMNRAQAASIVGRLYDLITLGKVPAPATPSADPAASVTISGVTYTLGMPLADLTAKAGAPSAVLQGRMEYQYYVFHAGDWKNFFVAGVNAQKKVGMLYAIGGNFSYRGVSAGATDLTALQNTAAQGVELSLKIDAYADRSLYAVELMQADTYYGYAGSEVTKEMLYQESQLVAYITNAYKAYHGIGAAQWGEAGAAAARLHSEYMAKMGAIGHYEGAKGSASYSPGDRLRAQGVTITSSWSENVCGGYADGIEALDAWINSYSHRGAILSKASYLGVGMAYAPETPYVWYYTTDFWS